MITVAEQISKSSPNFSPWKITIQKVHKISGGPPSFTEFKLQSILLFIPSELFQSPIFITCQETPLYIQSCDSQRLWGGRSWLPGLLDQKSPALPFWGPFCDGIQETSYLGFTKLSLEVILPTFCLLFHTLYWTSTPLSLLPRHPYKAVSPTIPPKAHLRGSSPSQDIASLLSSQKKSLKNTHPIWEWTSAWWKAGSLYWKAGVQLKNKVFGRGWGEGGSFSTPLLKGPSPKHLHIVQRDGERNRYPGQPLAQGYLSQRSPGYPCWSQLQWYVKIPSGISTLSLLKIFLKKRWFTIVNDTFLLNNN